MDAQVTQTTAVEPKKSTNVTELEERTVGYPVVQVTSPETFEQAANNLRDLKTLQDEVDGEEKKATKPLNEALKQVRSWFRPMKDRLQKAEQDQRRTMADWKRKQDELAAEAARKAEADARAERERLEAQARAEEEKARRAAEEKRRQAAEAEAAGNRAQAEKLQAAAAGIEHKGNAKADNLVARASTVVAGPVAPQTTKVEGLSNREVWKFEVTDPSKVNPAFLMPDEKKIGKTVKALKADAAALVGEGVRIWSEADFSARRR